MKTFTKSLAGAFLVLALFVTNNAEAQDATGSPFKLNVGVEGGMPTYSLRGFSKAELGGTLRLQYNVQEKFAFTLTSGYYNLFARNKDAATTTFGPDSYDNKPHSQGIIPVKIGVKDFVCKSMYIGLETGAGFETKYDTDTKFIVSPGIGFAGKTVDVGLRYEYFTGGNFDYGFVGLRVGFTL